MTDIRDEARQALEGIHGGPWRVDSGPSGRWVEVANRSTIAEVFAPDPTAEFIAASPTLVAGLLAELERVEGQATLDVNAATHGMELIRSKAIEWRNERDAAHDALQQVRETALMVIEMFRDVESRGEQLYYAPLHRAVDLLAEVLDGGVS